MTSVSWHPQARRDLFEGSDFYEDAEQGLGESFLDCVAQTVERLSRHPLSAPIAHRHARGTPVRRFPYTVIYRLDEEGILILAVAHQKRRPLYWTRRLRD